MPILQDVQFYFVAEKSRVLIFYVHRERIFVPRITLISNRTTQKPGMPACLITLSPACVWKNIYFLYSEFSIRTSHPYKNVLWNH